MDHGLQAHPSETTALLAPGPVADASPGIYRQEIKTLVRYTLPVIGFAYSASA